MEMLIAKKWLIPGLLIVTCNILVAQDDPINHILDSLIPERHVKELRVDLRSIDFRSDTTYFIEIQRFDKHGNKVESISSRYPNKFQRYVSAYDNLNRQILIREYYEDDTTQFHTEKKWIFLDSSHYQTEIYVEGKKVIYSETASRSTKDTLWITKDEYDLDHNVHNHQVSRYRYYGDTLQISEFIKYDDKQQLNDVNSYYLQKRSLDTGTLVTEGVLRVKESEWDQFHNDRELMRDFNEHPEKYIQMQLDGKFKMEFDDSPFIYRIYNLHGQLVQDGHGIISKQTFTYNANGQLIRKISWGLNEGEYNDIVPITYTDYEYNALGLPVKNTETRVKDEIKRIMIYTYNFW